jgi:hypothetical protein
MISYFVIVIFAGSTLPEYQSLVELPVQSAHFPYLNVSWAETCIPISPSI